MRRDTKGEGKRGERKTERERVGNKKEENRKKRWKRGQKQRVQLCIMHIEKSEKEKMGKRISLKSFKIRLMFLENSALALSINILDDKISMEFSTPL